jgi:hypothetical protein
MSRNLAVMENRKVRRRRVFKAALIQFPGGTFSCVVRDLSETGALLELPGQLGSARIQPKNSDGGIGPAMSSCVALGEGDRIAFMSGEIVLSQTQI